MDSWEITRTAIALAALIISAAALFFARRDRSKEAQEAALKAVATSLGIRIDEIERTGDSRHDANTKTLDQINSRLAAGDEVMRGLPNHRDIAALRSSIGEVTQSVSRLEGAFVPMTNTIDRISQFLMERGSS